MKVFLLLTTLVAFVRALTVCTPETALVADSTFPACRNVTTWDLGKYPYLPYTETQWAGSMALTASYLATNTQDDVMCLQSLNSPYAQDLQTNIATNFPYTYYGINTVQSPTCACTQTERIAVQALFTTSCVNTVSYAAQLYCYKNSVEAAAELVVTQTCYRCITAYNTYTVTPVSAYTTFATFLDGHCSLNTLLTQEPSAGNCPLLYGETGLGIVSRYELTNQIMVTVSPNVAVLYAQVTLPNQARSTQIFCTQTALNQTSTQFPTTVGTATGLTFTTAAELNLAQSVVVQQLVTNQRTANENMRTALLGATQNSNPNTVIVSNFASTQSSYDSYAATFGLMDAYTAQTATMFTPTSLSLNNLNTQVSYTLLGVATLKYNMSQAHAYIGSTCPADFVEAITTMDDQFFTAATYSWFGRSVVVAYTGYASQYFAVTTTICDTAVGSAGSSFVVLGMALAFVVIVIPLSALFIKGNEQVGAKTP